MGKQRFAGFKRIFSGAVVILAATVLICVLGLFIRGASFITVMALGSHPIASLVSGQEGGPDMDYAKIKPPDVSAQTAIVMEKESGTILYEKNPDERVFPASTTKIMTALLAIENSDLDKIVTVTDSAIGVEGSSIYLEKGEQLPLRDLVYGLMLRSGNDAAVAIACEVGGSVDHFVELMNRRAKEIGAENTHFVNPNGLHNEEHYTTARDMALIGRQAMHNPTFTQIAQTKTYEAKRAPGKYNYFYNKNKVIYQYTGGTGIKIGYTKAAGRTLVASSKRGDMELICVVMNDPNWFDDTYRLMDYAYGKYQQITIAKQQQELKAVRVKGGDKDYVQVGTRQNVTCPIVRETSGNISVQYLTDSQVKAPVSRWQQAGVMNIYQEGKFVYGVPLYYLEDIERK